MKNSIFFEPPSRLQMLDKLKHMVRFSDFLLLVSGEHGAGKSTLVERLKPDLSDNTLFSCVVSSETGLEQEQLLDQLLSQLPSHDEVGSDFSTRLKTFYLQLKAFREAGQKCLIIVDDAENLSTSALELLLNLHQADGSAGSAQLLLLMNSSFAEKLLESKSVKLLEGRVHHLQLDRMSDAETQEYVSLCHPVAASLPAKKLTQLIQLSEGLPGRVDKLVAGDKVSSQASVGASAFPLPTAHMGGIGLILVGILAVSLWQFFPEQSVSNEKTVSETVSVPLPVPLAPSGADDEVIEIETAAAVTEKISVSAPVQASAAQSVSVVKHELKERLALQESKLEKQKAVSEKSEKVQSTDQTQVNSSKNDSVASIADELREVVQQSGPSSSQTPVVTEAPPAVKTVKVPEVKKTTAPVAEPKVQVSKYSASETKILSWKSTGYTLQLLGARSQKSALDFMARQQNSEQFYYFSTVYKGAPWHVVIFGEFANRDIANSAIQKLPAELKKMRPWSRSVRGVQIDIKKK